MTPSNTQKHRHWIILSSRTARLVLQHSQPLLGLLQLLPQLGLGLAGEGVDQLVGHQLGRSDALDRVLVYESAQQLMKTLRMIRQGWKQALLELLVNRIILAVARERNQCGSLV